MPKRILDKRSRLVKTAVKLTYQKGFRKTTIADIAEAAGVPLGNVFYYFKTKEEIGEAIVEQRMLGFQTLREKWNQVDSPKERLKAFVQNVYDNRELLARGGCPVGTFCTELHKEEDALSRKARSLLGEPLAWLEEQFRAIGRERDSKNLAIQLLSALQGVSVLANNFRKPEFVSLETSRLMEWIGTL